MKKYAFIFLLLIFPVLVFADAGFIGEVGQGAVAAGGGYEDITLWLSFENCGSSPCTGTYTTSADDYSAGDTTGAIIDDAEVNDSAENVGTYGLWRDDGGDSMDFAISSDDIISGTEGRIGFYLYINTWASSSKLVIADQGSGNELWMWMQGTDEFYCRYYNSDAGPDFSTSAANIAATTWYFVELAWKAGTPGYLEVFVNGSTEGTSTTNISAITLNAIDLKIAGGDGNAGDFYIDNFIISNDSTRDLNALKDLATSPR